MLYLVRLEYLTYIYSANARKEGKLMFKVVTWLYLMAQYRDVSRQRLFVPGLFVPNMQNARHLMFRPIIPDVSSHICFSSPAILD